MPALHVVILAAGKGTRMKSARPKVLHEVAGVPMIQYVLDAAAQLHPSSTTVVVGHGADLLTASLSDRAGLRFAVQEPQLGTGHALLATEHALAGATGTLLLLSGDVPLLTTATLTHLLDRHHAAAAAATVLTAALPDPHGYGRIVRSGGAMTRIVEERDASPAERDIREVNAGVYALDLYGLFDAVRSIASQNAQREYYLPDLVSIYRARGRTVETAAVPDAREIRGINSRADLAEVSRLVRHATNTALMAAGVTFEDPETTYVDRGVTVGADTVLHPGVRLQGSTAVGTGCAIHAGTRIVDSRIGDRAVVYDHSVVVRSTIGEGAAIGPFAHLRNQATVGAGAKVGNFVEMKKTALGAGSKAMHLAYLGDATIGADVNIGAGTITCNYDGVQKQQTVIEDGAFVGSDTQLIAPVTVGRNAYVGTGTTVREDVPPNALAVSAGKQRNIEDWVTKKERKRDRGMG
jgi:bifunctional UDP-N-acetylglucosamine pyrophosphorylase/glucosamine-1-phosphate N-acetyltransferase